MKMKTGFRLQEFVSRLDEAGLDGAVITSFANFRYVTGVDILSHACLPLRLQMVVVPVHGDPVLLACETGETLTEQAPGWLRDIRCYREFDASPIDALIEVLKETRIVGGRLGYENESMPAHYWERLRGGCPQAEFQPVGPILDSLRAIKSAEEIVSLRAAYENTVASIREAFEATCIGDSEADVAARIGSGLTARGATHIDFNIVVVGERSPWAHPPPSDRKLGAGEVIRVDVGVTFGLFAADVGRTAAAGQWPLAAKEAFDGLARVREEVLPYVEPGISFGDLYTRFMDLYPQFNLPRPAAHTLLIGHSIGVEVHESPILSPTENAFLEPNMVINIEPDVRPDGLCLTHECTHVVTSNGLDLIASPADAPMIIDS